jgi:urea transport system substrate-binding protein
MSRKRWLRWFLGLAIVAVVVAALDFATWRLWQPRPIIVGILHSRTGPLAISERGVIDAVVLALEEINRSGGLLGRPVRWVIADGASDEAVFAREAKGLIERDEVSVIFGCWTSASRKAVRPVVEERDHLLVYPVQYEGCETSPNIFYIGAAPNQQIIPAVAWSLENLGTRVFVVGSDYIFPRVAAAIIGQQVRALGGVIEGEEYVPLGSNDVREVIAKIVAARPDLVLNTINGDTNVAFFRELRRVAGAEEPIPVMSVSIAEGELAAMEDLSALEGQYAAWNYFQSVHRPENRAFVAAFQARYGAGRVTSDPIQAAYCGVRLWSQAVREAGTEDPTRVRTTLRRQSLNAPEGIVSIDPETQHAWRTVRIGRIGGDGQFTVVWSSQRPVRPLPYPMCQPPTFWNELLQRLYEGWGERWSAPAVASPITLGIRRRETAASDAARE